MTISISSNTVAPGGKFTVSLSGYTPNTSVFLVTQSLAGKPLVIQQAENAILYPISSAGTATISLDVVSNASPGSYVFTIYNADITQTLDTFTLMVSTTGGTTGGGFNIFDPMTLLLIGGIGIGLLFVFSGGAGKKLLKKI